MISDELSGYYCYAQIDNVSADGMCFESDHLLKPGSVIDIQYENPPFKSAPKGYRATVTYCNMLTEEESAFPYRCGVKYR
jgi:hypothetical protein